MAEFISISVLVVRVIIGLLFLIGGLLKVPRLKKFFVTVVQYGILKGTLARVFAYTLPFAEVIVGILLLTGFYLPLFSVLALLMLLVSTFGVVYALLRKNKMDDCGCYGGVVKVPVGWKKVVENLVFIILNVFLVVGAFLV